MVECFNESKKGVVMSNGNGESKILEKAFQELAHGCEFTNEERELLEKLDGVLKKADIMVNKDGTSATIATSQGFDVVGAYPDKGTKREKDPNKFGPSLDYEDRNITDDKANFDAKILNEAYKALADDFWNNPKETMAKIEKLDELLVHADIVISDDRQSVTIIQDDGNVYTQGNESFADRARGR